MIWFLVIFGFVAGALWESKWFWIGLLLGYLLWHNPAHAAPPPDADMSLAPWFHSLKNPTNGGDCCAEADCRQHKVQIIDGHYEVLNEGVWLVVSPKQVLPRTDNPVGDWIACVFPYPTPHVLCLVRPPGT